MQLQNAQTVHRARTGHTLVELLVASVAGSMLLAALASTMYIAREVAYSPVHAQRVLESTTAAFDLVEELRHATYIVDYQATSIELVTDDRNGDGVEDTHRYAWSGVPGDPLTKTFNRGTPATVVGDVHHFHLDYVIAQDSEQIEVVAVGSELQLGSQYNDAIGFRLDQTKHLSQSIDLSGLPASASSWTFTGIRYHAKPVSSSDGAFAIQLRTATSDGTPTSEVLWEHVLDESSLGSGGWFTTTALPNITGLSPHGNYCVVFLGMSNEAAEIRLTDNKSGASTTQDDGATWSAVKPDQAARLNVLVRPGIPDAPLTLSQDRLKNVHVSLQQTASAHARINTAARLENEPLLARGFVGTEFDADPTTQDANGDGSGDFAQADGGSFDTTSLASGWWSAAPQSAGLIGGLSDDATLPVDVRFRAQALTAGAYGAAMVLDLRLSATEKGRVAANVQLNADGTQTLDVWSYDGANWAWRGRADGLTSGPVEVRIVADPVRKVWVYFVNGVACASLTVPAYSEALPKHQVMVYDLGTEGRFDYVYASQPKDG